MSQLFRSWRSILGDDEALSEPLLHFAIPFAAFSYFRKPREAFAASLIALLPDVDALFGVHRSMTHSLVVVLASCGIMLVLMKAVRPKLVRFGVFATLGLLSHLLLDVFTTYTPILWPLVNFSLFVSVDGGVHMSEIMNVKVNLDVSTRTTDFTSFTALDAPLFTSEGFAIALILIGAVLVNLYSDRLRLFFRRVETSLRQRVPVENTSGCSS